jgi:hypothetical protein
MRKTYLMLVALMLSAFGVMNVSAGERIPFDAEHFTFHNYDGWGVDANETGVYAGNFLIDEVNGCPIGDTNCNAWVDLGSYSKMYVKMAGADADGNLNDSNPRIFINRTADNGQFNADKSAAACLVLPNGGTWAEDYYTVENDGTYVIDLTKIGKEWGFVHFHSIKGSAWNTQAIVYSIEVEKAEASQQVGWVNLINNSDMEGDDNSSFFTKIADGAVLNSEITDGVGNGGSRGILVATTDKVKNPWDNQFWFRFNEEVPAGTKYRVSFDYRADEDAGADTQAHNEPSDYIHYDLFGKIQFTNDWQTYTKEGEVTAQQSTESKKFLSVAFNLNDDSHPTANNYYFDNIKFEVYKYGTTIEFAQDVILVDFGFDTNIPALVEACGKPRLLFPNDMVKVTSDGEEMELLTVEGFPDGRFYIFTEDGMDDDALIEVTLTNPADAAYHLIYTSGPGGDIKNFTTAAVFNSDIALEDDAYSYMFVRPTVLSSDPEEGSFNLPNSIKEFKLFLDKNANCSKIVATLNGKALKVQPADGYASEITLVRSGDDLPTGEYTLKVEKILAELPLDESDWEPYIIKFFVGKVEYDPNDVPKEMMPDYFSATGQGEIPEGWYVVYDGGQRMFGETYGSGANMKVYADGGDFNRGFYTRTNNTTPDMCITEYGNMDGYTLPLEAGKKYNIHYNAVNWKAAQTYMKFEILNSNDEVIYSRVDANLGRGTNASTDAHDASMVISGSLAVDYPFIPEYNDNYRVKWTPAANLNGDLANGMCEVVLGGPRVTYIPNQIGIEETQLLQNAIANAKAVRDANSDDRYNGATFDALVAAITKYEAEAPTYTNPSVFKKAAAALDAAAQALNDHRALCDNFDKLAKTAMQLTVENAENKFAKTELYAQIKTQANQYATTGTDDEGNVTYIANPVKDDDQLTAAIADMTATVDKAALLFTTGPSAPENANGGKATGVAVLVDRLRLGVEALKKLGVDENEEAIVLADNALTDDDAIAEAIKNRMKLEIYGQLKDGNDLFYATGDVDPATDEPITESYDMTVFVKNPNTYKQQANMSFTDENVPGWITPEGFGRPGLTVGWGHTGENEELAVDVMFQTWGSSYRVEQTIEDLPAGVYTIRMGFGERMGDDEANLAGSFIYAKTSATPVAAEGEEEEFAAMTEIGNIGQSFPFATPNGNGCLTLSGIAVADGFLTIGANAGSSSHTFFNEVRVVMTGAAKNFDYGKAYEEVLSGIDVTTTIPQSVRAVEIYDLNGRRIAKAQKGVNILRKMMNDGTIVIEKVLVK